MVEHPALSPLLERIAQQETRHVAFYTTQARAKLDDNDRAQMFVRLAMTKLWKPVGSGIMDDDEVRHAMHHLFAGQAPTVDKLDQRVQKFPGLEDATIFRTAFEKMGVPL